MIYNRAYVIPFRLALYVVLLSLPHNAGAERLPLRLVVGRG